MSIPAKRIMSGENIECWLLDDTISAEAHNMAAIAYFDALSSKEWCEWRFGGEENARSFFDDLKSGTEDAVMRERYGNGYKRTFGIIIACYDEDNANLRYPIKITHDPDAVYEWCAPSKADPNQGWPVDDDC